MTTSRADARAALFAALEGVDADVKDRPVKPGEASSPAVLVNYQGSTPTEFLFQVEVYVKGSDADVADAQDVLDTVVQAVDDALDAASIGPPGDTATYDSALDSWVCVFAVNYPRTDF